MKNTLLLAAAAGFATCLLAPVAGNATALGSALHVSSSEVAITDAGLLTKVQLKPGQKAPKGGVVPPAKKGGGGGGGVVRGGRGGGGGGRGLGNAAGAAAAIGIIGGVLGAIGAQQQQESQPVYEDPDAVRYCMSRYRSYDPRTGFYIGNDGRAHPCP